MKLADPQKNIEMKAGPAACTQHTSSDFSFVNDGLLAHGVCLTCAGCLYQVHAQACKLTPVFQIRKRRSKMN